MQYTFDGSADETWSEYNANGVSNTLIGFEISIEHTVNYWNDPSKIMCNLLEGNKRGYDLVWVWTAGEGITGYSRNILVAIDRATVNSVTELREFLQSHPMTVLLPLDEAIETPLSDDELAAYRALHTYDGTTVVTTDDALASLEVDYIVKPKAYIEKKLTAIETRLNALEISEGLGGE